MDDKTLIKEELVSHKVAIILPMYNHYAHVNICIDSIARAFTKCEKKVFILDDHSAENESIKVKILCEYLKSQSLLDVEYIFNEKNLGFAGNVNKGIRTALSEKQFTHICILNSDTIVSPQWLDDLIEYSNDALVSPVSNNVGNEQLVRVDYDDNGPCGYTRESVFKFSSQWRTDHIGSVLTTQMLGFFCVLGAVKLFEDVGYLDEAFGRGYFEDDDYCHRVLEKKYELRIVRQAFVHHFGSITFKSLKDVTINDLFKRNLEIFIKKHNKKPIDQSLSWIKAVTTELEWQFKKNGNLTKVIRDWFIPKQSKPPHLYLRDQIVRVIENIMNEKFSKHGYLFSFLKLSTDFIVGPKKRRDAVIKKIKIFAEKKIWNKILGDKINNSNKNTFVVFPIQSYFGRYQRPQQIVRNFPNKNNLVIWLEPEFKTTLSLHDHFLKIDQNFYILYISGIDYSNFYTSGITEKEKNHILSKIESRLRTLNANIKFIIQSPFWGELTKQNKYETIYDCMDLHIGFTSSTFEIEMLEKQLLFGSSKIITSSEYLNNYILKEVEQKQKVEMVKNACDPSHFLQNRNTNIKNDSKITVGYFGAIADWFEGELIYKMARLMPEVQFELIGEITNSFIISNEAPANIRFFGEIPYKDLPQLCSNWKCALIPFKINELILATNPVKLYEYSALGLPVVSTRIPEVMSAEIKTYCASTAEEFSTAIRTAIKENSTSLIEERYKFALNNSWKERSKKLLDFALNNPYDNQQSI